MGECVLTTLAVRVSSHEAAGQPLTFTVFVVPARWILPGPLPTLGLVGLLFQLLAWVGSMDRVGAAL